MGKGIFVLGSFLCCAMFFCGCSMMPNDDEIINGSISESEIFSEGEIFNEKDNHEVREDGDYAAQEGNDENGDDNADVDVDVEFEVVN